MNINITNLCGKIGKCIYCIPHVIRNKSNHYFYSKKNQYDIKRVEDARNIPLERRANVYLEQQTKDYLEAEESKKKFPLEMYVAQNHT